MNVSHYYCFVNPPFFLLTKMCAGVCFAHIGLIPSIPFTKMPSPPFYLDSRVALLGQSRRLLGIYGRSWFKFYAK